jgi:hypothetical protein
VEVTGNGRTLAGLEVLDGRVISRQEIRRVDEGELLGGGDACALFLELVVIHRRHLCKPPKKRWMYILTREHFRGNNRRGGISRSRGTCERASPGNRRENDARIMLEA